MSNLLEIARRKRKGSGRAQLLSALMTKLSDDFGESVVKAYVQGDEEEFRTLWSEVGNHMLRTLNKRKQDTEEQPTDTKVEAAESMEELEQESAVSDEEGEEDDDGIPADFQIYVYNGPRTARLSTSSREIILKPGTAFGASKEEGYLATEDDEIVEMSADDIETLIAMSEQQ